MRPSGFAGRALSAARMTRAAPSQLVKAMRLPSGKNATPLTVVKGPSYLRTSLPLWASQTRTTPSSPPETIRLPSGEKAAHLADGLWAWIRFRSLPDATSQI